MDPLTILLAIIAGTAAASDQGYQARWQRDQLHRALGIHGLLKRPWGSVDDRLKWITQKHGPEIGWLVKRAVILWGEPWYGHTGYAEIGPLLPWLAWRFSKGDAADLRAVLTGLQIMPHVHVGVSYEPRAPDTGYRSGEAYSDLDRLTKWLHKAKPELFQLTWAQAKSDEQNWYAKNFERTHTLGKFSQKPFEFPIGEPVLRFNVENTERHPWILTRIHPVDPQMLIALETKVMAGSGYHQNSPLPYDTDSLYILWNDEAEPTVLISVDAHDFLHGIIGWTGDTVFDWDKDLGHIYDGEEIIDHLKVATRFIQPDLKKWWSPSAVLLAYLDIDEDQAIAMMQRLPELLNRNASIASVIMNHSNEWYGPNFLKAWADAVNADYDEDTYTYSDAEIAEKQWPSLALVQWMEANELSNALDSRLATEAASLEDLPGVLEVFRVGEEVEPNPDGHSEPPVWQMRIHDILEHPDGPQLQIQIQILVVYSPLGHDRNWKVLGTSRSRFRADASDDWQSTQGFDDFENIQVQRRSKSGGNRFSSGLTYAPEEYAEQQGGNWFNYVPNRSLDMALRYAWKVLIMLLKLEKLPTHAWKDYFPQGLELLDPPEHIIVNDLVPWEILNE